ncbi:MAG: SH3 domain-containing protein [Pyrinomonadaceae bacterium]
MSVRIICLVFSLLVLVLTGFAQSRAIVTSQTANLRAKPDSNGEVLTTFEQGAELEIDSSRRKNGFFYAASRKIKGWVSGEKIDIKIKEPGRNTVWLFIGRTQRINDFSVSYFLNVTQLIRNGNRIKFWTKAEPDNKKPYLARFMNFKTEKDSADFQYNADLWEGDCGTKKIRSVRSLLFWRGGTVNRFVLSNKKAKTVSGSVGQTVLGEACKMGKKV